MNSSSSQRIQVREVLGGLKINKLKDFNFFSALSQCFHRPCTFLAQSLDTFRPR